jgi:hypothetical protein
MLANCQVKKKKQIWFLNSLKVHELSIQSFINDWTYIEGTAIAAMVWKWG